MKKREIDWKTIKTDSPYVHKVALEGYAEQVIKDTGISALAIEVGANYGATSAVLSQYFNSVITIDAWYQKLGSNQYDLEHLDPDRLFGFYETVRKHKLFNVIPILSTSDSLLILEIKASMAFLDGDHNFINVTNDINNIDRCLVLNSLFAIHDYHFTWGEVILAVDNSQTLKDKYELYEKREDGMICFRKIKL